MTEEATVHSMLATLLERVDGVRSEVAEFNRRAAHRELVIDRLHEENREHRGGLRRIILEPVVADLIRLYDGLIREVGRLAPGDGTDGPASLFASFADEVELTLDRCGVECYRVELGEVFRPREHSPSGVVVTHDSTCHNTAAEVISAGFRDRETGKVRRPAKARFYQYRQPDEDR